MPMYMIWLVNEAQYLEDRPASGALYLSSRTCKGALNFGGKMSCVKKCMKWRHQLVKYYIDGGALEIEIKINPPAKEIRPSS